MEERPFEVELTPIEEHRSWRHRRSPPPEPTPLDPMTDRGPPRAADDADAGTVVTGPAPGPEGWSHHGRFGERGRLVTATAVVGVIALLLGWMLGRAGGGAANDEVLPTGPTTSTPETTLLPGEPLPPVRTTAPRRTSTTTTPEIEIGTIAIDERIAGAPIELVAWSNRHVVEVDLAAGTTRTIPIAGVRSVEPEFTQVGPDWVLLMSGMSDTMWIARSDGSVEVAALGEPWSTKRIPGTDRFLRVEDESWPGSMTLVEVTLDGSPTGVEFELATTSYGWADGWTVDPAGGVITVVAGGVYTVDVDGPALLGRGDLVAAGTTATVLRSCDEVLDCGYVVVDRRTGTTRELVPVDDRGEPIELESAMHFWGPFSTGQMSPDGRWAVAVIVSPDDSAIGLIALDGGRVTALGHEMWPPQVHFSTDGRYAFHQDSGGPWVLDLDSGDHFPVFAEHVSWQTFGVRDAPTAPVADHTSSPPPEPAGAASSG